MKIAHCFVLFALSGINNYGCEKPPKKVGEIHLTDSERNTFGAVVIVSAEKPELENNFCDNVISCAPKPLQKRIELLTNFKDYTPEAQNHINMLKRVVLYGPSGTGKTTAARVLAQRIGRPYLFVQTGMLANEYANSGSSGIRRIMNAVVAGKGSVVVKS